MSGTTSNYHYRLAPLIYLTFGCSIGEYGQDIFTLRASFIEGRPPKSVNMYWRRFALSSIPLDDARIFEEWLREKWVEKDALLDLYMQTGRFPGIDEPDQMKGKSQGSPSHIETSVRQRHWWEIGQIFVGFLALTLPMAFALRRIRSLLLSPGDSHVID